ncbi:sodium:solute symporter [Allorhodopirellula heiligendammensis]|uniref:Sodium/glucose cotransporter n=1 Tax=Allorhodopirellula heiligendammensis TaxID=2714739 RepID=A0A5C6C688_9BACT|nr:sodium:solute symporter [Allorhodopirellula heiligendammensis]TWU18966.1 Sodium/glucose cotransporter [Allorhodopirellula heiligendammensis]
MSDNFALIELPVVLSAASNLTLIDWGVIAGYFLIMAGVVAWSSRRQNSTADYFLAGRNVGWFVIGTSLFASNIGSEHIVGLAGQGAVSGLAMAHYELHAWIMIMLAWFFVPFYYRTGVYTVPEFLELRFGPTSRWILSVVSLVAYVFTKVSVTVYAGAVVFSALLPDTFGSPAAAFWIGAIATVLLTGLYTVFGGLRAVLFTDAAQALILLIGSICITFIGLKQLGGWEELRVMAKANADAFALWRPIDDPDFPWLGILIGSPIVGIWYWCTDQYIVQRTLSAKNLRNARRGALWGGVLKVWPVFIFLIPGLIGWALHSKGLIAIPTKTLIDGGTGLDGDKVFPTLVTTLLPVGLRGLVVAGLLAALMSSLSSLFNSAASLFTIDIYQKLRPGRSEQHLVRVGRIATLVVVVAGLAWIPVMARISGGGLYEYLQSVQGYLAPPITAVFVLGLLWPRMNSPAAVVGLTFGFALGLGKTIVQAVYGSGAGKISSPALLAWIGDANFLYFSSALFAICLLVIVVTTLCTRAPDPERVRGLTWGARSEADVREIRESWTPVDVVMTVAILGLVLGIYLYFTFWLSY